MNTRQTEILTGMCELAATVENQAVDVWRTMDTLLAAANETHEGGISYRGTSLIREALIEAKTKQSEVLQVFSPVADLLRLITSEDDADAVG